MQSFENNPLLQIPGIDREACSFLTEIGRRFPKVREGIAKYTAVKPCERILLAACDLEDRPRTGWLRFKIPLAKEKRGLLNLYSNTTDSPHRHLLEERAPAAVETILEHSLEAKELHNTLFLRHRGMGGEILKYHDFVEAIIGDFTPRDPISREEKRKLELLALNILTESRHDGNIHAEHVHNCILIFEAEVQEFSAMSHAMTVRIAQQRSQKQISAHQTSFVDFVGALYMTPISDLGLLQAQVKDTDYLQMAVRGLAIIRERHSPLPHEQVRTLMDEFWDSIQKRVQTDTGKLFYEALKKFYHADCSLAYVQCVSIALGHSKETTSFTNPE